MDREEVRFFQAAALLPPPLRRAVETLPAQEAVGVEELRLRVGQAPCVSVGEREWSPAGCRSIAVTVQDLAAVLEIATQASTHTALERVRNGFFTVRGGHRIGICGSCIIQDGQIRNLRQISSLAIRVAHQISGVSAPIRTQLVRQGQLKSTLILSPPGGGKTTLLRDLICAVSNGDGMPPRRVGVVDERSELAAMWEGQPQLEVGRRTDVLDACPKGMGLLMLLRGMNPQVLAVDEITAPEDSAALEQAANCGVILLSTAHGDSVEDLYSRPLYRRLLEGNVFQQLVLIERKNAARTYRVLELEAAQC